jgi:DNA-binding MarR family transcriptional regulator
MTRELDHSSYPQEALVARLLNRMHTGLAEVLDRALAPYGLTYAQYAVWSILASGRAESATEICKEISYDPGSMTRMLDRLEQKDLLRRIHNRENRRKLKLELTERGEATYPEVKQRVAAVMDHVMGAFSGEELDQLASLMVRMVARLEEEAGPGLGALL